ncbi:MAG: insulinase family protein [Actinomycetia bacterium]|nr:insulinase family protein [Actinomycetes bacterium]
MNHALPRPVVGKPLPWTFPRPLDCVLDNGLRVQAFHLPGQYIVTANVLLDAPLSAEPRTQEGVATLALRACDEGTPGHPGATLAEAIENQGATLGGAASLWGSTLGVHAPATRLEPALGLLAEILADPTYDDTDIARHVALRLAEIGQVVANPAGSAAWAIRAATSDAASRASRPNGGLAETVGPLTPVDVRAFHDRWWDPRTATVIIAGHLPQHFEQLLQATLGTWSPTVPEPPAPLHPNTLPAGRRRVWVVDHPEAVQADIRLGRMTPTRTDPAWPAAQVASIALGGSFGSRLNTVLREKHGFTYGASCSFTPSVAGALFTAQASCRLDVAVEATCLALETLDVARAPLTDAEASDAIAYAVGVAPLRYDTAEAVAAQAGALAQAGLPASWIDDYHEGLRAVTADRATAVFAEWVDPAAVHLVLAGPADALVEPLIRCGLDVAVVDAAGRPAGVA